jgi:predicted DsbA family dithiol-disulfide isomerase
MTTALRIDFVSDVACPWCAIGLASLDIALNRLQDEIEAQIHVQPFELNPHMPPGGQDITEHLTQKYGSSPEQQAKSRDMIRARGAEVGFSFSAKGRSRTYNTFNAHRLMHWAETEGSAEQALALKRALLSAYHGEGKSPDSIQVLLDAAVSVGLPLERASELLASDQYADDVREREQEWLDAGIHSVPAVIINRRHLISGGQPPEVFEAALRKIAQAATTTS